MHTFVQGILRIFYLQSKIDRLQGANVETLEAKIQQHIGAAADGDDSAEDFGQGLVSI